VEQALKEWDPRIDVQSVAVTHGDDPALVLIEILYAHRLDGRPDNFVYPFYLE
jgi:phage baseplate assembly protein W